MKAYTREELIDEIRSRANLLEVALEYLPLKRTGQNYKTLCPFHKEKTPSFVVSPTKGIFHCFGCGVGGDVFSFIMKMEKVGFSEAVRILAKRCGVDIPSFGVEVNKDKEVLYKINEMACNFFHQQLFLKEGVVAFKYLRNRGLKKETIVDFKLGYAPKGWGRLRDFLFSKGFDLLDIEKTGLIIHKEKRKTKEKRDYYDRFRQRIIFPIIDIRGRVVGFGARSLGKKEPKYLNSPETPVYNKSEILYGIDKARVAIREKEKAVIVEGYMDVIIAHQYGLTNVVGICGTALTLGQARLLKSYTKNAIILYDPDPSGRKASLRGVEILLDEGFWVKIASLPSGYDPADLLVKEGKERFEDSLSKAKDFFEYKLELTIQEVDLSSIEGKRKVVEEILPVLIKASTPIQRHMYIKKMAEVLEIDERVVREEVKVGLKGRTSLVDIKEYVRSSEDTLYKWERELIGLLLKDKSLLKEIWREVLEVVFTDPVNKRIISLIKELIRGEREVETSKLIDFLDDEAKGVVSGLLLKEYPSEDSFSFARACLRKLKEHNLICRIQDLQRKIPETRDEELREILSQYQNLIKEVKALREGEYEKV
jgi:DNA primase